MSIDLSCSDPLRPFSKVRQNWTITMAMSKSKLQMEYNMKPPKPPTLPEPATVHKHRTLNNNKNVPKER